MEILIATSNAGKVSEFSDMLGQDRFIWRSLKDFPHLPQVPETGHTFRANAVLKARGYALASGRWAMADDSGLEVDALGQKPGVFSARWAEMNDAGQGDGANNALLMRQLANFPAEIRSARFVCVLALSDPAGRVLCTVREVMEGSIGFEPAGSNGFGYDPLFRPAGLAQTSAELSPAEKHRISHRGKALRRLKPLMEGLVGAGIEGRI